MGRKEVQKGKEKYEPREVGRHLMLKRRSSDEVDDRDAKRPASKMKQRLYLLVDDWERGYSIRKLDVDAFDADGGDSDWLPEHFTELPVARMEAVHDSCIDSNFVSHGPKIFGMQPGEASPAIPAFDAHTLSLTICPWPSCHGDYLNPFFVSVGGKLFLFMNALAEYLSDPPPHGSKTPWSWTAINARPPFKTRSIICYAPHPDGRTLFVSAGSRPPRSRYYMPPPYSEEEEHGQGTFSFDAERLEWTRHGAWLLPFAGQAHFDAELESWVGLCDERDGDGCLCACDVAPVAAEFTSPPAWKLGGDRLFRRERQRLHLGAKLVHMGDSRFCLVEALTHEDDARRLDDERGPLPRRRVLRMTTFGVKFGKKGELRSADHAADASLTASAVHATHAAAPTLWRAFSAPQRPHCATPFCTAFSMAASRPQLLTATKQLQICCGRHNCGVASCGMQSNTPLYMNVLMIYGKLATTGTLGIPARGRWRVEGPLASPVILS